MVPGLNVSSAIAGGFLRRTAVTALCLVLAGAVSTAQRQTLAQMVAEANNDINISVSVTSPAMSPFAEDLARTDYVVRATIGPGTSRLTDDGYSIDTTFELRNPRVLFARAVAQSSTAGPVPPPLVLSQEGGTVPIGGFKARVSVGHPNAAEGMDLILFLRKFQGRYWAGHLGGMYEVRDGRVFPMDKGLGNLRPFEGMTVSAFQDHILSVAPR
jgi:hypothetical protein